MTRRIQSIGGVFFAIMALTAGLLLNQPLVWALVTVSVIVAVLLTFPHAPASYKTEYHDLIERLPIGVYRSREDGTILRANAALATLLGVTASKNCSRLMPNRFTWIRMCGNI